eukprot:TRINITY_DN12469_c0_g1_i19.p1 TRINITY_DN12469_c0_g1~~TRINITY_DN12469_c0_g1_i19.p1  ORF type:complete len:255 (-),score=11.78 TRINITY_DN12469_c0_g1_i19:786-1550(-)
MAGCSYGEIANMRRGKIYRLVAEKLPAYSQCGAASGCKKFVSRPYLWMMHSFFALPSCLPASQNLTDSGAWRQSRNGHLCGACDTYEGSPQVRFDWNVPGCTEAMCVRLMAAPEATDADIKRIGPAGGLEMHPICAWGMTMELNSIYKGQWRTAAFSGPMDIIGKEKWSLENWGKQHHNMHLSWVLSFASCDVAAEASRDNVQCLLFGSSRYHFYPTCLLAPETKHRNASCFFPDRRPSLSMLSCPVNPQYLYV